MVFDGTLVIYLLLFMLQVGLHNDNINSNTRGCTKCRHNNNKSVTCCELT